MSHKFKKPSKVVSSGEVKGKRPQLKVWFKKYWKVLVAVLAVALVVTAIWITYQNTRKPASKVTTSTACTDKSADGILGKAAPALAQSQAAKLQPVVEKIKTLKDYNRDPNCLAVITTYYVNISDAKNARTNYDLLIKVYQPNKGYDPVIANGVSSPAAYKANIDFLDKQIEQTKKPNNGRSRNGA